jgi:sugar phosphate isomerase/epimerase
MRGAAMKIAYGTYAMPTVPLEEAIPALDQMGYDGIEIAIGPKHTGSMPDQIDPARREKLKSLLKERDMGVPALFMLGHVLVEDSEAHGKNLKHVQDVVQMARDLGMRTPPVLSMGIGGKSALWETQKSEIVRLLKDYAKLASQEGFILAVEAHCGAAVDRSERALWVIKAVDSPWVRLHFDIVHFYLAGEGIEDSVKALVPITAHTHITDARKHKDGTFDLLLLGQGDLDSATYVKAMHEAGWNDFLTLEVSVRVWSKEGYDPLKAASFCYATLDNAIRKAGVPRT